MRLAKLAACIAVGGIVLACENPPSAVEVADGPLYNASNDNWEFWFGSGPDADNLEFEIYNYPYVPCVNGGAGEPLTMHVKWYWLKKVVVTKGGHINWNVQLLQPEAYYVGDETGDVWHVVKTVSRFTMHQAPDGTAQLVQPINEWWENAETGQRIHSNWHFHTVWSDGIFGTVLSSKSKLPVSCSIQGK